MDEQPDPPSFRLSPLTAALLIPALCAAVLASLWLGSHARSTAPTAVTSPNPLLPTGTPGPTPWPLVWPPEDGGSVDPQTAYGVLAIVGSSPLTYTAELDPHAAVPAPERPDPRIGTVQRLRPLDQQTADAIARRLGSADQPNGPSGLNNPSGGLTSWPDIDAVYSPATSTFRAPQLGSVDGRLASAPRDTDSATRAADAWLIAHGLADPMAPLAAVQVSRGESAAFPTWQVTVPHLAGQSDATEISLTVSGSGQVSNVLIVHPLVLGAAPYPIVDWEKAWTQVQAGRARDADTSATGASPTPALVVDRVALTARIVQTGTGPYAIPAWAFTDTANRITVYWPALDPAWYTLG